MRIISGGQTGVDRAALDVALEYGVACGGWGPAGRLDEHGRIPDRYPVMELPEGDSEARTSQNVIDSDGTLIVHHGHLGGGSRLTFDCCIEQNRPHLAIDAAATPADQALSALKRFVQSHPISTLNVAGPRETEWPRGYQYVFGVLESWLRSRAK